MNPCRHGRPPSLPPSLPASPTRKLGALARDTGSFSPFRQRGARAACRHGALQLQEDHGGAVRQGRAPVAIPPSPPSLSPCARRASGERRPHCPAWPRPSPSPPLPPRARGLALGQCGAARRAVPCRARGGPPEGGVPRLCPGGAGPDRNPVCSLPPRHAQPHRRAFI